MELIECPPYTEIFSKRRKIYSECVEDMRWWPFQTYLEIPSGRKCRRLWGKCRTTTFVAQNSIHPRLGWNWIFSWIRPQSVCDPGPCGLPSTEWPLGPIWQKRISHSNCRPQSVEANLTWRVYIFFFFYPRVKWGVSRSKRYCNAWPTRDKAGASSWTLSPVKNQFNIEEATWTSYQILSW